MTAGKDWELFYSQQSWYNLDNDISNRTGGGKGGGVRILNFEQKPGCVLSGFLNSESQCRGVKGINKEGNKIKMYFKKRK